MNAPHAYAPTSHSPIILPTTANLDRFNDMSTKEPHAFAALEATPDPSPRTATTNILTKLYRRKHVLPPTVATAQKASAVSNAHCMVTRGKDGIFKPKAFTASLELKSVKQTLSDSRWLQAINDEFQALMKNNT